MTLKNAKAKGSRNELKSIALLEAAGYQCTKSGGSLGVFDIIGVSKSSAVLVQCKTNRWASPAEMEAIKEFPCPGNFRKLVHRWRDRQRLPDVREV